MVGLDERHKITLLIDEMVFLNGLSAKKAIVLIIENTGGYN